MHRNEGMYEERGGVYVGWVMCTGWQGVYGREEVYRMEISKGRQCI